MLHSTVDAIGHSLIILSTMSKMSLKGFSSQYSRPNFISIIKLIIDVAKSPKFKIYLMFQVKDDKHKLTWRNCCDLSHAWTGLVKLCPGNY